MEKPKRKPTIKMQKAAIALVGNGGNVTKAMLEAGYSEATANTPGKLTKSMGWQELLDIYLPDDMLLRALSDDIEKKEGNRTAELQLAVKMKGKLIERVDNTTNGKDLPTPIINVLRNDRISQD